MTPRRFDNARAVFEFGCGTGSLAARLLQRQLPADARYLGADISDTMTSLSMARLKRFGRRAAIMQADGTRPLPLAASAFDRFLAVYVLDLLGPAEATAIVAEARRLLRPEYTGRRIDARVRGAPQPPRGRSDLVAAPGPQTNRPRRCQDQDSAQNNPI